MKIEGKVTSETMVEGVVVDEVWKFCRGRQLGDLAGQVMKDQFASVQFLKGDGGVGTILQINFHPGGMVGYQKEVITKIDDINRVKEIEMIEGGFIAMGVDIYRIRLEIIENGESSIIKSTVEYEMDEQFANIAPLISTKHVQLIAETAAKYLTDQKKKPTT